jgi:excisionase family DNA binding protein
MAAKLDEYLTVRQATEYLGISPNTPRARGEEGKLPMHRNPLNAYRLFEVSDLDEILKRVEQSSGKRSKRAK